MQLANLRRKCLGTAAAVGALVPSVAAAESRATIRGAYYREASTRVVQPVVEIAKDLPSGTGVAAYYLLDAITSASVAAGVVTDEIFTEHRNEVGLAVGQTLGRTRIGAAYRYSAESDYWAHGISLSLTRSIWEDTGTMALSLGRGVDSVAARTRTPDCAPRDARGNPFGNACRLDAWFGGLGYTQVLSPTWIAQVGYELSYLDGVQSNLYRSNPAYGYETLPTRRFRHSATGRTAVWFPAVDAGLQIHYRFYFDHERSPARPSDPWRVVGHTVEGRAYKRIGLDLDVRAAYRLYLQDAARLWCDWMKDNACYGMGARIFTFDPKLGPVTTHLPELRLDWEARALSPVPVLAWFATGAFEVSYGYLFQSTTYGGAHLLQAGYSMPL